MKLYSIVYRAKDDTEAHWLHTAEDNMTDLLAQYLAREDYATLKGGEISDVELSFCFFQEAQYQDYQDKPVTNIYKRRHSNARATKVRTDSH